MEKNDYSRGILSDRKSGDHVQEKQEIARSLHNTY